MKNLTGWAALLLAAMSLNSCSQDAELEAAQETAATTGALTPEQKAQIMELAEYYDLDVTIDETRRTRGTEDFNVDSLNAEFRMMSNLKGRYVCTESCDSSAVFLKEGLQSTTPLRASIYTPETTTGSFDQVSPVNGCVCLITVQWTYYGRNSGIVSPNMEMLSAPALFDNCEFERRGLQYQFVGAEPSFTFFCDFQARKRNGVIVYTFKVFGDYSNHLGHIVVS